MFLVISVIITSCAMYAGYVGIEANPMSIHTFIKQGDKVKIVTKDKGKTSFVVVEVTDKAIVGESETVLFTDITKLQKEVVSGSANFWKNNYTVGEYWWTGEESGDTLIYNPLEKEWEYAD